MSLEHLVQEWLRLDPVCPLFISRHLNRTGNFTGHQNETTRREVQMLWDTQNTEELEKRMRYFPVNLDIELCLTFTTMVVFHSITKRTRIEFGTAGEFTLDIYCRYQRQALRAPWKNGGWVGENERLDHHPDVSGKHP